jgi:hypothetical protein
MGKKLNQNPNSIENFMSTITDTEDIVDVFKDMYVKLDVKQKTNDITKEVKEFVDILKSKYMHDEEINNVSKIVDMLIKIESNSIISIYKQQQYLEHIIDTVMIKIDENYGGSAGEYMVLLQLQSALVTMTQNLLFAIRQLPANIRGAVQSTLMTFEVETVSNDDKAPSKTIKSADLIDQIESIHNEVINKNIIVDNEKPDELPEDWNISDDALMRADSVEDARIIDAKNKEQFDVNDTQQSFNMPGADRFADDEFDNIDDDVDE